MLNFPIYAISSNASCEREFHTGCLREHKKIYLKIVDLKVCFHFGGIGIGITYSDVRWIVFLGKDVSDDNNSTPKNIFVRTSLLEKDEVVLQGGVTFQDGFSLVF
uniref:Uncharacterized protein n=1 Tax=Lactuca sativa TaxID=4236 RepID=A0A9R1WGC5_LACSA|nr:hypothetical protein LSAT_V11C100040020 [Lactuca sativa]